MPLGCAAALSFWFVKKAGAPRARTPPADVPAEFRRRRRSCSRYGLTALAGFGTTILAYRLFTTPLPGLLASTALAVAIAVLALVAFAIGSIRLWAEYRCPACEQPLTDGDVWLINPTACPSCGARLV